MLPVDIESILKKRAPDGWVPEAEAKAVFASAGVGVVRFAFAAGRQQAQEMAQDIGYPVAVKAVSVKIVHKSDAGAVKVGIQNADELGEAWDAFERLEAFEGMVIDEMLPGLEMFLGARDDDAFGPVVLLGLGGTAVEIYQDIAIRMAPLEKDDVLSMVRELKGGRLLTGYRGRPDVDMGLLAETVVYFSRLAMDLAGRFSSMEANPLMCTPGRCAAADARIMLP